MERGRRRVLKTVVEVARDGGGKRVAGGNASRVGAGGRGDYCRVAPVHGGPAVSDSGGGEGAHGSGGGGELAQAGQ